MSAGIETAGLLLLGRGYSTWALTTPSTVPPPSPAARAAAKASSRLGPTCAVVPAWASVWQTPQFSTEEDAPALGVGGARAAARSRQRDGDQGGEQEQQADGVGEV